MMLALHSAYNFTSKEYKFDASHYVHHIFITLKFLIELTNGFSFLINYKPHKKPLIAWSKLFSISQFYNNFFQVISTISIFYLVNLYPPTNKICLLPGWNLYRDAFININSMLCKTWETSKWHSKKLVNHLYSNGVFLLTI